MFSGRNGHQGSLKARPFLRNDSEETQQASAMAIPVHVAIQTAMVKKRAMCRLQPLAWNQNEEDAQSSVDEKSYGQNHHSSFGQELTDIWLSNS